MSPEDFDLAGALRSDFPDPFKLGFGPIRDEDGFHSLYVIDGESNQVLEVKRITVEQLRSIDGLLGTETPFPYVAWSNEGDTVYVYVFDSATGSMSGVLPYTYAGTQPSGGVGYIWGAITQAVFKGALPREALFGGDETVRLTNERIERGIIQLPNAETKPTSRKFRSLISETLEQYGDFNNIAI